MNTQQISDKILQNILLQDYFTAEEKNKEKLPEYIREDQKEEEEEEEEEEEKEEKGSRKNSKTTKGKNRKRRRRRRIKWS